MLRLFTLTLTLFGMILVSGCSVLPPPKETNNYIVLQPGEPLQALANKDGKDTKIEVLGLSLDGKTHGKQEIQGWMAMPPSHWKVLKEQLDLDRKLAEHKEFQEWVRKILSEPSSPATVPASNSTPPK